jgi:hypothetical protein
MESATAERGRVSAGGKIGGKGIGGQGIADAARIDRDWTFTDDPLPTKERWQSG